MQLRAHAPGACLVGNEVIDLYHPSIRQFAATLRAEHPGPSGSNWGLALSSVAEPLLVVAAMASTGRTPRGRALRAENAFIHRPP